MKFAPKSEKEIAEDGLMAPGNYDFEIRKAEEQISKAGSDMIKLTVVVQDENGAERVVFDYLLEAIPHKLRHAAECCGLLPDYEAGTLDADDFVGKTGTCKVSIKKDKTGAYPDQNQIVDYLRPLPKANATPVRPAARQPAMAGGGRGIDDDDIPFAPCWQ